MQRFFTTLFLVLMCSLSSSAQSAFVKVKGGAFQINNKPYYYIGTNYWYGGLLALEKSEGRGKARLRKELDFMKEQGVNNLRVLVGAEGRGLVNGVERVKPALQPDQGEFNDAILEGLDFLLAEMGKRKMYAVLFLSNNWEWSGGFLQYLNWNKVISDSTMQSKMNWDDLRDNTSKFYSCGACKADYERQLRHVLSRVNKYTGKKYTEDPAIMAWELANEPRPMRTTAVPAYKQWIVSVTKLIRKLDKNHLITLGTEGIMGTDESADLFREIHAPGEVDYLTLHIWPKNWGWFKDTSIAESLSQVISRTQDYIGTHEKIAQQLNKPLVVEEFGLPRDGHSFSPSSATTCRDQVYKAIFDIWKESREQNGRVAGCNFWTFGGTARPKEGQLFWKEGDDLMGDPPQEEQGLNSVFDSDTSTWNLVRSYLKGPGVSSFGKNKH